MKRQIILSAVALLALGVFPTPSVAQHRHAERAAARDGRVKLPKLVSAKEKRPARKPGLERRVALLRLSVTPSTKDLPRVEVESVDVIDSHAPKVFARKGGDWRVTLHGPGRANGKASYTINNPIADIEVESEEGADTPFHSVRPNDTFDWTLVVPLYKDDRALSPRRIEITDIATGRRLANVPLTPAAEAR